MNVSDTAKVQRYLRQRFGNHKLTLARRENKDDSAELMLEDEFIGVVFRDDEDGDTYWNEGETVTIREGKGVCSGPESDIGGCKMTFQIKTIDSEGEESLLQELEVTVE